MPKMNLNRRFRIINLIAMLQSYSAPDLGERRPVAWGHSLMKLALFALVITALRFMRWVSPSEAHS
jgi:hypothetical protein